MGRAFQLSPIFLIQQISHLRCVCERFVDCALGVWSCLIARLPTGYFFYSILSPLLGLLWILSWGQIPLPYQSLFLLLRIYLPYTCQFFSPLLSLCWVSRTALLHIHSREYGTSAQCYGSPLEFPSSDLVKVLFIGGQLGNDRNPQGRAERGSIVIR